jgi:hypothetical protein
MEELFKKIPAECVKVIKHEVVMMECNDMQGFGYYYLNP